MIKVLHVSYTTQRKKSILLVLYMNMQKYGIRFYLLKHFQLLKWRMFDSKIKKVNTHSEK